MVCSTFYIGVKSKSIHCIDIHNFFLARANARANSIVYSFCLVEVSLGLNPNEKGIKRKSSMHYNE